MAVYEASGAVACNQTKNVLLRLLNFEENSKKDSIQIKTSKSFSSSSSLNMACGFNTCRRGSMYKATEGTAKASHAAWLQLYALHLLSKQVDLQPTAQQQQLSHGNTQVKCMTHMQSKASKQAQEPQAKPTCHSGMSTGMWEAFYTHRFHYCQIMRAAAFFT